MLSFLVGVHIGLVSRIIKGLDSVLLYVVKVTKSEDSIGTMCNQFSLEIRLTAQSFALFHLGQFYYYDTTQASKLSKHDFAHFSPVCAGSLGQKRM